MMIPAAAAPHRVDEWLNDDLAAPIDSAALGNGPFDDPSFGNEALSGFQTPVSGHATQNRAGSILFQCNYGVLRTSMVWLLGINLITATFLIWAGIFWNTGWSINNAPLPPLATTILFELVGFGLWIGIVGFFVGYFIHRNKPQRVAVTTTGVIIPRSHWSTEERVLPWAEVKVKLTSGPMQQLRFMRGWWAYKVLVSTQFTTNSDFESLLGYLRKYGKL